MKKIMSVILCTLVLFSCTVLQAGALEASGVADARYTVVVLDRSGSMTGKPMEMQLEAAVKFCESVLNSNGNDFIAVVSFGQVAKIECEFSNDLDTLKSVIENITIISRDPTNTTEAFEYAGLLLDSITDSNAEKNVLFCSDGLPYGGMRQTNGKYTYDDYDDYRYANAAYDAATNLWPTTNVYGLGFFYDLTGEELEFGIRFIADISNKNSYIVDDLDDLIDVFGDIADDIVAVDTPDEPTETPTQPVVSTVKSTTTTTTVSAAAVAQAITTGGAPITFVVVLMVVFGSIALVAYRCKNREEN